MSGAMIDLAAKKPVLPEFPPHGICILESHHEEDFKMPPSSYKFSEVMLILDGKGWVVCRNIKHPVAKGSLVLVSEGDLYHFTDAPKSPMAMLCLCIKPLGSLREIFTPVLPKFFTVLRNPVTSREVSSHLRAILLAQAEATTESAPVIIGESLQILTKLSRRFRVGKGIGRNGETSLEVDYHVRVRDYVNRLATTFHETDSIDSASESLRMSPRSFSSHFRKITHSSHLSYVRKLRITHACQLLRSTQRSVTGIAFACGYEDLSSFFRAFRKERGMSPGQWRERNG